MMFFPRAISSSLAWIGEGIARLVTWIIFSAACYFVIELLPFDFMGSIVIGGWVGTVLDIFRIVISVATIFLYVYYSFKIFLEKDFYFHW